MAIEIQITTVETEILVDDHTGKEILPGTGWVLTGIPAEDGDPTYHFQSLSNLLNALATRGQDIFGLSGNERLQQMAGVKIVPADARILEEYEFACDGSC